MDLGALEKASYEAAERHDLAKMEHTRVGARLGRFWRRQVEEGGVSVGDWAASMKRAAQPIHEGDAEAIGFCPAGAGEG